MTRTCTDCATTLGRGNKSGRCRPCLARANNADPEIVARRKAAIIAYNACPEVRKAKAARLRAYLDNMPEADRIKRREHGLRQVAIIQSPAVFAKTQLPEVRAHVGKIRTERALGWCPLELRGRYRELTRGGIPAADARRMLEAEIPGTAEHARREVANHALRMRLKHEREVRDAY